MPQAIIAALLARESRLHELRTARFCLHSQGALEVISVGGQIPQEVADIRELCFKPKVSAEEARQLTVKVESVIGKLGTLRVRFGEHVYVLSVIERLCALGAKLIRAEPVLSNLTSPTFSLGKSRRKVRNGHFAQLGLYRLDCSYVDAFEGVLDQLLPLGTMEPFEPGNSPWKVDCEEDCQVDQLQELLLCFGMSMARTQAGAAFLEVPELWRTTTSLCSQLSHSIRVIAKLNKSEALLGLPAALPPLVDLIRTETSKGLDQVTFATMLATKPGIKALRAAVDAAA